MRHLSTRVLGMVLLLGLCACSGAPQGRKATLRTMAALIQEAVRTGPVTVRHNPVSCDCPAFEIWLNGAWVRAEITGPSPGFPLESLFGQPPATSAAVVMPLTLDSSRPEFCPNGTLFFRTTYVPPEPPAEGPTES